MEIKPQDLRLGNLIGVDDEVASVTAIGKISIYFTRTSGRRGSEHLTSVSGIELTPEWLERFGFKRMSCPEPAYRLGDVIIEKDTTLSEPLQQWHFAYWIAQGKAQRRSYTTHVHALQNLYFIITGEELAIDKTSLKN